jgi:hypothetical protein
MASNDRELLELAAKAAGIDCWFPRMADGKGGVMEPCHRTVNGETAEWNPRKDNADAFALAVKLCMNVNVYHSDTRVTADDVLVCEYHGADPEAATRLAIVKAAAEIGRNMK